MIIPGLVSLFNKDKAMGNIICPWKADCPSHIWRDKNGIGHSRIVSLPTKIQLMEQVQPLVSKYKCKYCGLIFLVGKESPQVTEHRKSVVRNPALIGGRKVI